MDLESNKFSKNEGIDHISDMPDAILCKILSQMPTKYAMGTKILSTRWKNISPFEVPPVKLYLDDLLLYHPKEHNSQSFVNFVDKLLFETLRDGPSVENVFLRWSGEYDDDEDDEDDDDDVDYDDEIVKENVEKIVAWISAALRLNVVYLNLNIPKKVDSMAIFQSLNGCTTLVELELGEEFNFHLCGEFILPNLKSLFLNYLVFEDESINAFIGGCPVLNEFSIKGCDFLENLYVKSPLLKLFVIYDCFFLAEVLFDAPNIEVLAYKCGEVIPDWVGADFKFLHSAYIAIDPECDDKNRLHLAKIVNACSSATRLCLSRDSITALRTESVQLSAFGNINWLALGDMDSDGFEVLACFLKSASIVQTLTFGRLRCKKSGGYERFESLLSATIPVCLKLCLKKIEFLDFEGEEDEMKLVEYFLKNARVLQEVTLNYTRCKDINIFNRLLMFPKHSKMCQILLKECKDGFTHKSLLRRCLSFSSSYIKVSSILEEN